VRRCGHAPPIAQDITRCFLHSLMRQFRDGHARATDSHFRRYLLDQLNTFLGGDWREVIDGDSANGLGAPADLETRNQRDNANATSPEQAYQHSFALEIVARAFKRLHDEAQQTGHLAMYHALEPHLARDPGPGEYEALAPQLQIRPLALVIALKRLRQRFRELVGQELADTVVSARDLATEQMALHTILRGMRAP
jgi:RNA polymerase sigma-70 factor (ECF subfamily)